jgi:hypothetical protein
MRCPICKAADACEATEHVMSHPSGTVRAPALECVECCAVVLHEVAPKSDKELAAVREAQNLRLNISRGAVRFRTRSKRARAVTLTL